MSIPKYIMDDLSCWGHTHIAPESYYDNHWMYIAQENADFSTMVLLTWEKATIPPRAIKAWQKWKAYYMHGENLTVQEMRIRQMLVSRVCAIRNAEMNHEINKD